MSGTRLPTPEPGAEVQWVSAHLGALCADAPRRSARASGTQAAADAALAAFDVTGYAALRNEVWPPDRRGASGLSPWIRHGLLTLLRVHAAVRGPVADVRKFRDELRWQEYARHVYARVGGATGAPLRHAPTVTHARDLGDSADPGDPTDPTDPWDRSMRCVAVCVDELERDGWLVNQTRMWLAAHWSVRHGADWRVGEDRFFTHLLDGSRAANRLGWQWTVGAATGRAYGFARHQVQRRAPTLCGECTHRHACPIEDWPDDPVLTAVDADPRLRRDPDPSHTAGPTVVERSDAPDTVWLTAESLGDDDPALAARPALPVAFVFDRPLLERLRLSGKRLVFLAERLAELGTERTVEVHLGDPGAVLAGRALATTFAPVPGWRRHAGRLRPVEVHPWPWLERPRAGSVASFSAWAKGR